MKKSYSKSKKNFLALLLSGLMVTSCAALASCKEDGTTSSSSSSSSTEDTNTSVNDNGLIKNANFQTADTKKGLNPIVTSVTGWTRALDTVGGNSAHSSQSQSGIIDTDEEAWDKLTRKEKNVEISVEEAKAQWSTFSVREKLAYYEYWKKQNPDDKSKIADKLKDFYESFNIDDEDIPTVNPGTHYEKAEDAPDTNVLMIHNQNPAISSTSTNKTLGSAQKYTSSSTVTVPAGAAAEFSVWVKTAELKSSSTSGATQDAIAKGAYIRVTHSVGNTSLPDFEVKNINTEYINADGANNGWVQYKFHLTGSSYTDTTFTVVLGLGQGSKEERSEQVNGYAFFDDIECNLVEPQKVADVTADKEVGFTTEAEDKIVNAYSADWKDKRTFALTFDKAIDTASGIWENIADKIQFTTGEYKNQKDYTSAAGNNPLPTLKNNGFDPSKDINAVMTLDEISKSDNGYLKSIYDNYLKSENEKGAWLKADQEIFMMMSADGVAYTAKDLLTFDFKPSASSQAEEYMVISFFVKTSDLSGYTGATVTLNDNGTQTSFTGIDTSSNTPVKIGDNEDYYDGWQQYFLFVENDYEEMEGSFSLSFNYGLTDLTGATQDQFYAGFAAFTGFQIDYMSAEEFEAAATGTYAKKVTVTGQSADEETTGNDGFDTAATLPDTIKEGFANLKNYWGVDSDSYYVKQPASGENVDLGNKGQYNTYANAGLLNKNYFIGTEEDDEIIEGYFDASVEGSISQKLASVAGKETAEEVWNTVIGSDATQPLLIWNDSNMAKSYGYIGTAKKTVSANSYAVVSLRVKAVNATASIYLIDMDDESYSSTLSIGSNLVYWYDKNGNICAGDPADDKTEIAFELKSNGLYQARERWSGYSKLTDEQKTAYFANLSAYAKDEKGNLIVGENGASHAYTEADEKGNVIAFYHDGGNYYADAEKKVQVFGLADITKASEEDETKPLPYRYLGNDARALKKEVKDTDGWVTVSFYIHTGYLAKNYRLEVWSGTRDGSVVNKSTDEKPSYVLFDMNNPGTAEDNFTKLVEEKKEMEGADMFESVFSYFDTDKFLRYDKALDTEKVGNLYIDSFDPTAQTAGVAYLAYEENGNFTVLADYALSEVEVVATAETEDDDNTTEEEDDHDHADGTNLAMLFSSLAIAIVLVFAIGSIILRKVLKNHVKVKKSKK